MQTILNDPNTDPATQTLKEMVLTNPACPPSWTPPHFFEVNPTGDYLVKLYKGFLNEENFPLNLNILKKILSKTQSSKTDMLTRVETSLMLCAVLNKPNALTVQDYQEFNMFVQNLAGITLETKPLKFVKGTKPFHKPTSLGF